MTHNQVLQQLKSKDELVAAYPLLEAGIAAVNDVIHGESFAPTVFAMALNGQCSVFMVGQGHGICVCVVERGIMYVDSLFIHAGAGAGLMRQVGLELQELAKANGLLEVRFKTTRAAAMKRVLEGIGFTPRCVEFAVNLED